jgi:hypothetical protein
MKNWTDSLATAASSICQNVSQLNHASKHGIVSSTSKTTASDVSVHCFVVSALEPKYSTIAGVERR